MRDGSIRSFLQHCIARYRLSISRAVIPIFRRIIEDRANDLARRALSYDLGSNSRSTGRLGNKRASELFLEMDTATDRVIHT